MSEKKAPRISDILERLNASVKEAEEENHEFDTVVSDKDAEVGTQEDAKEPCNCPEEEDMIVDGGEDSNNGEVGKGLKEIAKEAALYHRNALKKEAALFGEIFADSVLGRMGYTDMLQKTAGENCMVNSSRVFGEAYGLTEEAIADEYVKFAMMNKMASEEAYDIAEAMLSDPDSAEEIANAIEEGRELHESGVERVADAIDNLQGYNGGEDDEEDIYPESLPEDGEDASDDEDEDTGPAYSDDAPIPEVVDDAYQQALEATRQ